MLRIFYGPDTYSRSEAVAALKRELDSDGMLSANTAVFDGTAVDLAAVIATCDTVPFLAEHRLVIVSGLLGQAQARPARLRSARRPRSDGREGAASAELVAYIPRMPPSTTLLLLDGAVRDDNTLLRALRPLGEVRAFSQMGDQQVLTWIAARARALGASFEPRAASILAQSARGDLWTLASDVEKLALYAKDRRIVEQDVYQIVATTRESNIFAMIDATIAGNLERALQQLRLLLQDGAAVPYIITMIARQYRQLIIAEDLLASRSPMQAIAQQTEIRSDAALRRVIQQARRLGAQYLQSALERILTADVAIKRGEVEEILGLELLVTELAGGELAFSSGATGAVRSRSN